MLRFTFVSMLLVGWACHIPQNTTMKAGKLDGTWIPVKQEIHGTAIPKAAFEKQQLILRDSANTFSAESVDKGVAYFTDNKMDIYGREGVNAGKHFTAIYKLENGQLTICYNLAGNGYPDAFDTRGKQSWFLCVFEKPVQK
ncbi:MAG TPA: TIGR03067 domain-containing protein [Puia sp.]|nr:TIGR03067 domain-containing protein [Puia sp.]